MCKSGFKLQLPLQSAQSLYLTFWLLQHTVWLPFMRGWWSLSSIRENTNHFPSAECKRWTIPPPGIFSGGFNMDENIHLFCVAWGYGAYRLARSEWAVILRMFSKTKYDLCTPMVFRDDPQIQEEVIQALMTSLNKEYGDRFGSPQYFKKGNNYINSSGFWVWGEPPLGGARGVLLRCEMINKIKKSDAGKY